MHACVALWDCAVVVVGHTGGFTGPTLVVPRVGCLPTSSFLWETDCASLPILSDNVLARGHTCASEEGRGNCLFEGFFHLSLGF